MPHHPCPRNSNARPISLAPPTTVCPESRLEPIHTPSSGRIHPAAALAHPPSKSSNQQTEPKRAMSCAE
eukprot:1989623-Prorocentrum_lima.AAC.1